MKRLLMAGVSAAALLWPMTAHAEPISTFIATTLAVSTATAAAITTAIVSVAVSLVLTGIQMLLAPGPPGVPKPGDGSAPLQQSVPPVQYAVGRTRMSGSYTRFETNNANLYMVLAVKEGRWAEVQQFWLDDVVVDLDTNDTPTGTVPYSAMRLYWHDGEAMPAGTPLASNPLKPIIDAIPGLDANFRPDGVAALGVRCYPIQAKEFSNFYPKGAPKPSVAGKTTLVWDPRDPAQDPEDPDTWLFSANPVLQRIWYECWCPHGPRRDYVTAVLPRLAAWIVQANVCDELVPLKAGGFVPRYTCGFWWQSTTERAQVRASMMSSCDGWDHEFGDGSFVSLAGKYIPTTETLTDDDITGYALDSDSLDADYFNSLTSKYTNPDQQWGEQDAPPWEDDEAIIEHGLRPTTRERYPVQNQSQCRRLDKRDFLRANARLRGRLDTTLASIRILGDRYVRVMSQRIPALANAVIEIRGQKTDLFGLKRTIDFVVINENILDAWDAATEEGDPPPETPGPGDDGVPLPTNVAASAQSETLADNTSGVRLAVSWDEEPDRADLSWTILYRQTGTGPWTEQPVDSPASGGGRAFATTGFVATGTSTSYDVQLRASGVGGSSAYTSTVVASTATTNIAPGAPTGLTVTPFSGMAQVEWYNPTSTNFASASVRRASGSGAAYGTSAVIASGLLGAAGAAMTYGDTSVPVSGVYRYWVTAENASGTSSTPAGPIEVTITV